MNASTADTDPVLLAAAEAFGTDARIEKFREEVLELLAELESGSGSSVMDELIDVIVTARVLWERFAITAESSESFERALDRKVAKLAVVLGIEK